MAFLKIIWPNFIFCANTLHKNNKQIHLICGSQGVKTKICKLSFNSFFLKILFKSQILTSIISFDHPNKDLCFYGVIFVKYIGKIDRFGQSKIEKIQKLEIYWLHFSKWSTNCSTNVSNLQNKAAKWSGVNPALSLCFISIKIPKIKMD